MQNRPFCGLVYRKLFFRDDSLSRIVVITLTPSSFLCLAIGSTSHAAPLTVTFLLTFKIMGDFWPFNWFVYEGFFLRLTSVRLLQFDYKIALDAMKWPFSRARI